MKAMIALIFGTALMLGTATFAEVQKIQSKEAPDCEGRPEFITELRPQLIGGVTKLPHLVLIAKEADYYIESQSNESTVKMHSHQSFKDGSENSSSKVICGTSKNAQGFRATLMAPTLIDTTVDQKVGQSFWQFQVLADKQGFSSWNQRSIAIQDCHNLEKEWLKYGGQYKIYRLSRNQYEVVVSRETSGMTQYLSIKYDAVKSLD